MELPLEIQIARLAHNARWLQVLNAVRSVASFAACPDGFLSQIVIVGCGDSPDKARKDMEEKFRKKIGPNPGDWPLDTSINTYCTRFTCKDGNCVADGGMIGEVEISVIKGELRKSKRQITRHKAKATFAYGCFCC